MVQEPIVACDKSLGWGRSLGGDISMGRDISMGGDRGLGGDRDLGGAGIYMGRSKKETKDMSMRGE